MPAALLKSLITALRELREASSHIPKTQEELSQIITDHTLEETHDAND